MEKAALEAENNSLKEQVAKLVAQASAVPQAQPGLDLQAELNSLRQQNEGLTKNLREMAGKLNVRISLFPLLLQAYTRIAGGHSAESPSLGRANPTRELFTAGVAIA